MAAYLVRADVLAAPVHAATPSAAVPVGEEVTSIVSGKTDIESNLNRILMPFRVQLANVLAGAYGR